MAILRMPTPIHRLRITTAALFCATAVAAPAAAIEPPTAQARIELLDTLEREALYRDRVDWPEMRARLSAALRPLVDGSLSR